MDAHALSNGFVRMGNLIGLTMYQITANVGPPDSKSLIGNKILLQWIRPGYHMALLFDQNGVCLGIQHEYASQNQSGAGAAVAYVIGGVIGLIFLILTILSSSRC